MLSLDAKHRGLSCKPYNRNSCQKPFPSRSKQSEGCWKGSLAITTGPPQHPLVSKAAAQRTLPLAADRINAQKKEVKTKGVKEVFYTYI